MDLLITLLLKKNTSLHIVGYCWLLLVLNCQYWPFSSPPFTFNYHHCFMIAYSITNHFILTQFRETLGSIPARGGSSAPSQSFPTLGRLTIECLCWYFIKLVHDGCYPYLRHRSYLPIISHHFSPTSSATFMLQAPFVIEMWDDVSSALSPCTLNNANHGPWRCSYRANLPPMHGTKMWVLYVSDENERFKRQTHIIYISK